jgi:hypothetical protein
VKTSTRLIAIALLGALAIPAAAQAQSVGEDSVTGSGTLRNVGGAPEEDNYYAFAFDAHSGPSGENPSGTAGFWITTDPDIGVRGPVTCLVVQGKRAVIGIANDASIFGAGTVFEVTDDPDTLTVSFVDPAPTTDCSSGVTRLTYPITSGDITITDAPALPTSKGQCTNGGWRTFPGFRNQGDCVSFVATKGKNPPAQP